MCSGAYKENRTGGVGGGGGGGVILTQILYCWPNFLSQKTKAYVVIEGECSFDTVRSPQ